MHARIRCIQPGRRTHLPRFGTKLRDHVFWLLNRGYQYVDETGLM
jgi:hypothetical protein